MLIHSVKFPKKHSWFLYIKPADISLMKTPPGYDTYSDYGSVNS